MAQHKIQLSPHIVSAVMTVGREKTPVIIIDNFLLDTREVVDFVINHVDFDAEQHTYYPGFRAAIIDGYKNFVVDVIAQHLFKVFSVPAGYRMVLDSAYYSLVATPPDKLLPAQCRPHSDTARPYYLAVMHYLGAGDHGGTGFFRHKSTGFERITADRLDEYVRSVTEFDKAHGNIHQGYISKSTDQYELIGEIAYKPNRIIIYPGCSLHSGLINPETDVSKDPRNGRLTANIFLDFMP